MNVELIKARAADGVRLDGALSQASAAATSAADYVLALHGVGSNFYGSGLFEKLTPHLLELGIHVARVNTRGHDGHYMAYTPGGARPLGAAYEIVDDCRLDIAAWLEVLRQRGARRIGLLGHSLGAIKALYAQAYAPAEDVSFVAALSPPRLSYRVFTQSGKRSEFFASVAAAQQAVEAGRGQDLIQATFPFPLLIAAAAYLDKYGDAERYNIMRFLGKLNCPTLVAYGELELNSGSSAFAGVPEAIEQLDASGPLEVARIAEADHLYTGVHVRLANRLVEWIGQQPGGEAASD